jgi:hypothetical protein
MKLDPDTHKDMHLVLALKLGVTKVVSDGTGGPCSKRQGTKIALVTLLVLNVMPFT